jgi:hypothetical protein
MVTKSFFFVHRGGPRVAPAARKNSRLDVPAVQDQTRELERLGMDNVRDRLRYADAGPGAIVPALGDGKMLRGDVENWLAQKDKALREHAQKLQEDTLWWAKAAAWIGVAGILVAMAIAALGRWFS